MSPVHTADLTRAGDPLAAPQGPVIASPRMHALMHYVRKIGQTNAAVLITGETGCGKEVVAHAVHESSLRCSKPLVDLNCGAIPEHLLESELFGYDKGAFSGADRTKPGLFELAHGGTLFLDEIGEADMKTQVKLLRVLDGTPYYRLGGTRKISVDVRIIAATNNDLMEAVQRGRFRADLYYRLSQVHVNVPPLRERLEDIAELAMFFLRQHGPGMQLLPETTAALQSYAWPGNVRELRNTMITASLHANGTVVAPKDLPEHIQTQGRSSGVAGAYSLDALEERAIIEALKQTGGRQGNAADLLGISRRTLIRKLKTYRQKERPSCEQMDPVLEDRLALGVAV